MFISLLHFSGNIICGWDEIQERWQIYGCINIQLNICVLKVVLVLRVSGFVGSTRVLGFKLKSSLTSCYLYLFTLRLDTLFNFYWISFFRLGSSCFIQLSFFMLKSKSIYTRPFFNYFFPLLKKIIGSSDKISRVLIPWIVVLM